MKTSITTAKEIAGKVNKYRTERGTVPTSLTEMQKILKANGCMYPYVIPTFLLRNGFLTKHSTHKPLVGKSYELLTFSNKDKPVAYTTFVRLVEDCRKQRHASKKEQKEEYIDDPLPVREKVLLGTKLRPQERPLVNLLYYTPQEMLDVLKKREINICEYFTDVELVAELRQRGIKVTALKEL